MNYKQLFQYATSAEIGTVFPVIENINKIYHLIYEILGWRKYEYYNWHRKKNIIGEGGSNSRTSFLESNTLTTRPQW